MEEKGEKIMNKPTPGPWKWTASHEQHIEGQRMFLVSESGKIVLQPTIVSGTESLNDLPVTFYGINEAGTELEDLADYLPDEINDHPDAQLIAAAPDLLAAAELAWDYVETVCDDHGYPDSMVKDLAIINAAIAKARGARTDE